MKRRRCQTEDAMLRWMPCVLRPATCVWVPDVRGFSFLILVSLLLMGSACRAQQPPQPMPDDRMDATFTLTPRATEWIAGADVVLDLEVANRTDDTLRFPNPMWPASPQPTLTLTRPDGEAVRFSVQRDPEAELQLVTLPPQSAWQGELMLKDYAAVEAPGAYQVEGTLMWDDLTLTAPPAAFRIAPANFGQAALARSRAADGSGLAEVLLLQHSDEGLETLAATFAEVNPTAGEMRMGTFRPRGPVPERTTAVLAPYANYDPATQALEWILARVPEGVWVGNTLDQPPHLVTASSAILDVATPLAVAEQRLYLLALLDTRPAATLGYAVVRDPTRASSSAQFEPVHQFEGRPTALAATLGPTPLGSPVVVGAVLPGDTGTELALLALDPQGRVTWQRTVAVDGLLPAAPLALHLAADDTLRATFLARDARDPGQWHDVEVVLDREAPASEAAIRRSSPIPLGEAALVDALLAYDGLVPGTVHRVVVVRSSEGAALVRLDAAAYRPAIIPLPLTADVELVRGMDFWYGVVVTASGVTVNQL